MNERDKISFNLKPGKYYWKANNQILSGFKNYFEIKSEVGMKINRDDEAELENIGNVKINVNKNNEGIMIGHIILEPDETEKIEDKGEYVGREK